MQGPGSRVSLFLVLPSPPLLPRVLVCGPRSFSSENIFGNVRGLSKITSAKCPFLYKGYLFLFRRYFFTNIYGSNLPFRTIYVPNRDSLAGYLARATSYCCTFLFANETIFTAQVTNVDQVLTCHNDFLNLCMADCLLTNPGLLHTVNILLGVCVSFCRFFEVSLFNV